MFSKKQIKKYKKALHSRHAKIAAVLLVIAFGLFGALSIRPETKDSSQSTIESIPTPTEVVKITETQANSKNTLPNHTQIPLQTTKKLHQATSTPIPTQPPVNTPTPTPIPDNQPPTTNIYYPASGGEITYKIDGKVCAIATAPSDNVSSGSDIQTRYAFDGNSMSEYSSGRAYLCIDQLPNGSHSLKFQSKDKAGNEEAEKKISFTVNIPGN